jgi:hypothetical protein
VIVSKRGNRRIERSYGFHVGITIVIERNKTI